MGLRVSGDGKGKGFYVRQKFRFNDNNPFIRIENAFSEDGIIEFSFTNKIVKTSFAVSGIYKIETWGACGSIITETGPKGAYSKSYVNIKKRRPNIDFSWRKRIFFNIHFR